TQSGVSFARFSVATNRRWKDNNQQVREETDWHNVILWKAENLTPYLTKGEKVFVEGRLQSRQWEDNEGHKHSVTEIVAEQVILLGSNGPSNGNGKVQTQAPAPERPRTQPQNAAQRKTAPSQSSSDFEGITDDDVPF
ncbi:MAG: single-stranded DNA-binding protein, partial [Acidobacteriota bacterium]|nr:single-stranded DNA-binding protein [Acidobacteriota bacterium]